MGLLAAASAWVAAGCSSHSAPTQVMVPVEAVIASGDGQFGVVGRELSDPLRVSVHSAATGSPKEGLTILWDVTQGDATVVGVATTVTDSTGSSEVRLRLGADAGEIHLRASVAAQPDVTVTFTAYGVNAPTLTQVSPASVSAGDTVTLSGTDFSPVADQNTVLFSGIRGHVTSASSTELRVVVPTCLPARDVDVTESLGAVSTTSVSLTVTGGGELTALQVGQLVDATDDGGFSCYALPGASGEQYLALVYTGSSVGAAEYPFELTALSSLGPVPAPERSPLARAPAESAGGADPQAAWDEHLRALEHDLGPGLRGDAIRTGGPAAASSEVPIVGDQRTFSVLNGAGGFDTVTAVAQYVGAHAAIFVDQDAPSGGFDSGDLQAFSERFDDVIYPVDTGTYGATSDLDGNQRVVILFTPSVNKLTPRGSSGFIGGFFFGNDLLPDQANSNKGEIFYALVPDPSGIYSDKRSTSTVLQVVPAVLAHEFMHMIHFNQRVLIRKAPGQEALWLAEALAQTAEELVARAYDDLNDASSAELFRSGARVRAGKYYLQRTDTVSLVVSSGQGSLAERGAGFLFLLYLEDQEGPDVLTRLTQTTRTGVDNVEAQVGEDWPDLIADWWSANYLDGPDPESGPLVYPTLDLRGYLGSYYSLAPTPTGLGDFATSGSLPSSSAGYYLIAPPSGGSTTVRIGGQGGGPSSPQAILRMRIIRVS